MSRSYKKHTYYTDYVRKSTAWQKRMANRAARRYNDYFPKGNHYQKIYNPWFIHDWKSYETEQFAKKWYKEMLEHSRLKDYASNYTEKSYVDKVWKKYYKRK
jgi:hypothetical protein